MTRWYVLRGSAGQPLSVARIRQEEDGHHPEVWNGARWEYYPPVMSYAVDPLAADEVDEAGALDALRQLGTRSEG